MSDRPWPRVGRHRVKQRGRWTRVFPRYWQLEPCRAVVLKSRHWWFGYVYLPDRFERVIWHHNLQTVMDACEQALAEETGHD